MKSQLVREIASIDDALRKHTQTYFNSNLLMQVGDNDAKVSVPYDINDLMLLGALTRSDLLLSGATGSGKSHLSRMAMNGLYGQDGFTNLTVTPGLNETDFVDIDIPAIKRGEKTVKEAIGKTPLLTRPGAIINEINRTPEILQNLFISYLERIFSLKGVEFPVGVEMHEGRSSPQDPHYQFRIISINEGEIYTGTSGMDKAVRDRVVLEIPMDYFAPRIEDIRRMVQERNDSDLSIGLVNGGKLEHILRALPSIEEMPVSVSAQEFLSYMSGMSNCIKSPTGSKKGISFSTKSMCEGCHFAKDSESDRGNVCGSVYAPSDRSLINLKKVSRAVAALRGYKIVDAVAKKQIPTNDPQRFVENYLQSLQVTVDDICQVAPFVLASKIPMERGWVGQQFNGSGYIATKHLVGNARAKFKKFIASQAYETLARNKGELNDTVIASLRDYSTKKDPWAFSIRDMDNQPFFHTQERVISLDKLL